MTPDLAFWTRTLAILALEIGLMVSLAAVASPRFAASGYRRLLWLGTLVSVLLVLAGEASGVAHRVSRLVTTSALIPDRGAIVTATEAPLEAAWESVDADAGKTIPRTNGDTDTARGTPGPGVWWPGVGWLAGTLVLLAYRALGHGRLLRRDRQPEMGIESGLRDRADQLAERMGLRPVTLRYWTEIRGPVAYGIFRPSIALPRDFVQRFNARQRDAILLHELAHLAARDPLALAVADVICALAWWHPAVHWARRRLQAAMEAAADEASTLVPYGRTALAESLVRLARELTAPGTARGLGVTGASNRSQLAGRVEALLAGSRDWRRSNWRAQCITGVGAALVAFAFMVPSWPGRAEAPLSQLLLAAANSAEPSAANRTEEPASELAADKVATHAAAASSKASAAAAPSEVSPSPATPTAAPDATPRRIDVTGAPFPPDSETAKVQDQLERFVLPLVHFPNTPLSEVVRELRRLSAEVDPEKYGIWFHLVAITGDPEKPGENILTPHDIRIRMKEPLRNASLRQVVDAIAAASEAPITYEAGGYGVSFRPRRPEVTRLITRVYQLNAPAFLIGIGISNPPNDDIEPPLVAPRGASDLTLAFGKWLENAGVSMAPPNAFFFKSQRGWLMTRATEAEQSKLETLLAPYANRRDPPPEALLTEPPKSEPSSTASDHESTSKPTAPPPSVTVTLEVKVLEITDRTDTADLGFDWLFGQTSVQPDPVRVERPSVGDPAAGSPHADAFRVEKTQVDGQAAVVSEAQWRALLKVLESRGVVTMQAAPKIQTAEGRAAEVQIQDARTIVTAVDTNGPTSPHVRYHTETLGFGPRVQIIPSRRSDAWHLALFGGVSEFLGYDDPGTNSVVVHGKEGILHAQLPLPRLRVRNVLGEGTVPPGHSLMVRGPVTEWVTRTKGSWFRRSRKDVEHRRLYIVVTPIEGE